MAADDLATQGARSSAAMVLTRFSQRPEYSNLRIRWKVWIIMWKRCWVIMVNIEAADGMGIPATCHQQLQYWPRSLPLYKDRNNLFMCSIALQKHKYPVCIYIFISFTILRCSNLLKNNKKFLFDDFMRYSHFKLFWFYFFTNIRLMKWTGLI